MISGTIVLAMKNLVIFPWKFPLDRWFSHEKYGDFPYLCKRLPEGIAGA